MRSTIWLNKDEIDNIKDAISEHEDTVNSQVAKSIIEELNVAEARAESSRILSHNYKKIIGKDETQTPLRLDSLEVIFLQTINISEDLRKKIL